MFPRTLVALALAAAAPAFASPPEAPAPEADVNQIYQYFVASTASGARFNSGAYLWIPPATPKIRAVMVGIHNGLPLPLLQSPPVREVCRKHGIAQILMTPNGSEIGPVMLKDLSYDPTNPEKTAVYDRYLAALAEVSGRPELLAAPIVPLAHSAYMSFPFAAAMRRPEQCLAAIPIKAGMPDVYAYLAPGGKAHAPDASLDMRHVPILFIGSASQETVAWGPYPRDIGSVSFMGVYRRDRDDNPGTDYEPRNELMGMNWDMMSGHFDMLPRNYRFVAAWLDAIATARLPERPGAPLKNLALREGWLINPLVPPAGALPDSFPEPAPYLDFKGPRAKAVWFPNEALAREQFALFRDEPRRAVEMFTFLDPSGQPISLAHGQMAVMPEPHSLLEGPGCITLTVHPFVEPFQTCTVKDRDHAKRPDDPHTLENVVFPGKTELPTSGIALRFDPSGSAVVLAKQESVTDSRGVITQRVTLRLKRHRLAPDPGFNMYFLRLFHEGDERFAAAGRTCQISIVPQEHPKNGAAQKIDFPAVPDAPMNAAKIPLAASSDAGLPVDYFVLKGPGIIRDGAFVPAEIPANATQPIEVTVGAYQVGDFKAEGGTKPSPTVYQTFRLLP
jgi:hypothetical protein